MSKKAGVDVLTPLDAEVYHPERQHKRVEDREQQQNVENEKMVRKPIYITGQTRDDESESDAQ
jgi:hypothetical protein